MPSCNEGRLLVGWGLMALSAQLGYIVHLEVVVLLKSLHKQER